MRCMDMNSEKRIVVWLLGKAILLLLVSLLGTAIVLADETAAQAAELTETVKISSKKDPQGLTNLTDKNMATRYICAGGTSITIESDEPIAQVYLMIDRPVSGYLLSYGGTTYRCGENGFLHDYILLAEPTNRLNITFVDEKTAVCELHLFSQGETPEWVQKWQKPYEDADMLVLPTHADDEHLWFGGTMPYYGGELGYKVQVAYMTNHWGERYRPHELLNGLWKVGITAYPIISDFPDAYVDSLANAEAFYDRETILKWQVELLRRFKPEVVIAHDLEGEYGHGAHKLNASTILEAAPLAAEEKAFPELAKRYGIWELPKLYLHLYPENTVVMNWSIPLERFDGKTGFEMAVEGYGEHVSQHVYYFAVKESGKYDCRQFGLAYTTVGLDQAETPDFFQNVSAFSDEVNEETEQEESIQEQEQSTAASQESETENSENTQQSGIDESAVESVAETPEEEQDAEISESKDKKTKGLYLPIIVGAVVIVVAVVVMQLGRSKRKIR